MYFHYHVPKRKHEICLKLCFKVNVSVKSTVLCSGLTLSPTPCPACHVYPHFGKTPLILSGVGLKKGLRNVMSVELKICM